MTVWCYWLLLTYNRNITLLCSNLPRTCTLIETLLIPNKNFLVGKDLRSVVFFLCLQAEKAEKEKMKQVVLGIHERQEEEDYQGNQQPISFRLFQHFLLTICTNNICTCILYLIKRSWEFFLHIYKLFVLIKWVNTVQSVHIYFNTQEVRKYM